MAKKQAYVSKAHTTKITATSRTALKIRDNYYTLEATEERVIEATDGVNLDKEWELLFDSVNNIVDTMAQDTIDAVTKKK